MSHDYLIASFAAVHGTDEINFGDERGYVDWSLKLPDGSRRVEVNDGADSVVLDLSHDEMLALHARLTATLIADR